MQQRLQRSIRATATGLVINGLLAVIKLITGLVGHSAALVADAIESFADMASSVIVWRGVAIAARPADENHPYGHGRAETLAAAAVAVLLWGAALLIVIGAVSEIRHPHHAPAPYTLWVLLGVIVVKETLYRFVHRVGVQVENAAVRADAWHHRSDAITSAAAGLGISVALLGGPGYEAADDWAALFAAAIIVANGWRIARPAAAEFMDEAPDEDLVRRAAQAALKIPGVEAVEKCHGRKLGGGYVLDMHIEVEGTMSVTAAHELAHAVEDAVRRQIPQVNEVTIHVEPHPHDRS